MNVLNLDCITVLIDAAKDTPEGQAFISSCFRWNDAVHQKTPRRLTIFTTLSFERGRPEVQDNTPFARVMAPFGTFEHNSPHAKIASQFHTDENDIILHKTRWSAIMGNSLEQILKAQRIDTVVIVGSILPVVDIIIANIGAIVRTDSFWCCDQHHLSTVRLGLQHLCDQGQCGGIARR